LHPITPSGVLTGQAGPGSGNRVLIEREPGRWRGLPYVGPALHSQAGSRQVFWGTGDELGQELPLLPFLDALPARGHPANSAWVTVTVLTPGCGCHGHPGTVNHPTEGGDCRVALSLPTRCAPTEHNVARWRGRLSPPIRTDWATSPDLVQVTATPSLRLHERPPRRDSTHGPNMDSSMRKAEADSPSSGSAGPHGAARLPRRSSPR
jgi:hypothetical protein